MGKIILTGDRPTGKLHLGHAYDTAIQDIIIRYKKMEGFDTLWLPGMDHAAIATEAKVVKRLKDKGIDKYEYGIVVNALNEFRNKVLSEERETEAIEELLLKILDAPQKKRMFPRKYEEAR